MNRLSDLREKIVSLVEARDDLIASQGLDAAFSLPDGNWHCCSDNDYLDKYRKLRDCPIQDVPNVICPLSINHTGPWTEDTYDTYVKLLLKLGFQPANGLEVLEIGAGNGALAVELLKLLGSDTKYIICDIPESLLFSGLYLALTGHEVTVADHSLSIGSDITLVPNYWFLRLLKPLRKIDLAINTLSMSEMSQHQVRVYASGISRLIGKSGAFFEFNFDNRDHQWGTDIGCGISAKHHVIDYFRGGVNMGEADLWRN